MEAWSQGLPLRHLRWDQRPPALAPGNSCGCLFNLTTFQLLCWPLREGTVCDSERRPAQRRELVPCVPYRDFLPECMNGHDSGVEKGL